MAGKQKSVFKNRPVIETGLNDAPQRKRMQPHIAGASKF